ncbi:MAG: hypothetical protein EXQ85_10075 [Alphaproteobacteria bacterium]|nr:hypothetical protein [Alphaproteobacteria bacterium]
MSLVILHRRYGPPPETVEVVEADPGRLAADEVMIEVLAAPIAFQDFYRIRGLEGFRRPLPDVPGNRGVGQVVALGGAVDRLRVGERVYLPFYNNGCWREHMRAKADGLFRAPDGVDPLQLAT